MTLKKFWLKTSRLVLWGKKPKIAFTRKNGNYLTWYDDGKINIFQNCIEANLSSGLKNKIAIYNINKEKKSLASHFKNYQI